MRAQRGQYGCRLDAKHQYDRNGAFGLQRNDYGELMKNGTDNANSLRLSLFFRLPEVVSFIFLPHWPALFSHEARSASSAGQSNQA